MSKTEKVKQLASDIVADMDMDDLINYATDRMEEYFKDLPEDEFNKEFEDFYEDLEIKQNDLKYFHPGPK